MQVRKYFKDDSVLLDSSYLRHRKLMKGEEEKKDEQTLTKRNVPKGKDKTSVIHVLVPNDESQD